MREMIYSNKVLQTLTDSANDYFTEVYAQPVQKRNLLDFKVGIISLMFGNILSVFLFLAKGRELFMVYSILTMAVLAGLIYSAQKNGAVKTTHYAVTFLVTYLYGAVIFATGDNSRGIFIFGLVYPVLSIYVLKAIWGNLLIAAELATSWLVYIYVNPVKMDKETLSIYTWIYLMFWFYGIVMEQARTFMEKRLHEQQEELAYYADFDYLTKLSNRRCFYRNLDMLYSGKAEEACAVLCILDIDNFKSVNDTYGHGIGDEVLAETAQRIRNHTRATDICCRWGGEEFLILAPADGESLGLAFAQKICDTIGGEAFKLSDGRELAVTVSIGAVLVPNFSSTEIGQAVREADENLYRAKKTGKNRVYFSTPQEGKRTTDQ